MTPRRRGSRRRGAPRRSRSASILTARPGLELDPDPVDDRSRELERHGRRHVAVDALGIGGPEHLLGREVGRVPPAVDRLEVAGGPVGGREEPDGEVGARAVQAESVEAAIRQTLGVRLELGRARDPGLGRIVRVEPADVRDVLPELLVRGLLLELGVDELRPRGGRHGNDVQLVVMRLTTSPVSGRYGRRSRPCARRVEPRERAWRVRTRRGRCARRARRRGRGGAPASTEGRSRACPLPRAGSARASPTGRSRGRRRTSRRARRLPRDAARHSSLPM